MCVYCIANLNLCEPQRIASLRSIASYNENMIDDILEMSKEY